MWLWRALIDVTLDPQYGREILRLCREGSYLELDFVVGTVDALVRVASRIEEAYHLAHAGPYR